ncbi:MAG: hypothetical protein AABX55_02400 [Nanoarchaeota archaeon]
MFLNKKGVFENISNLILLIIIAIIIIGVFLIGYKTFLFSAGNVAACKNWVNIQATPFLKEVADLASPCVTTEEVIKDDDKNKIYEQLARNMYTCWDQYGKGEVDFYSNIDFLGSDHCRICSEIKIDESLKNKEIDIDDFEIYLSTKRPPNHRETYAEFFTKAKEAKLNFGEGSLTLESGKKLYSAFVISKSTINPETVIIPGSTEVAFAIGGCVVGGKLGGVAGSIFPGIGNAIGAAGGCAIGIIGGQIARAVGYADYIYPSITLFTETNVKLEDICGSIYYNPQELIK